MARTARGDAAAYGELVRRHHALCWRIAVQYLGNRQEAEDLVQAAFARILEAAPRYQPRGQFVAYMRTVTSRLCLDEKRRKRPEPRGDLPEPVDAESPGPEQQALQGESAARVRAAVQELPERQRLAVVLHYWGGAGYADLAEDLECSERAAEGLLHRARKALAAALGACEREDGEKPWVGEEPDVGKGEERSSG